jgi:transposase InsO family protein
VLIFFTLQLLNNSLIKSNMNKEQALRQEAIRLYLQGFSAHAIGEQVGRSRQWVYKWIHRYRQHPSGAWYEASSTVPHRVHGKCAATVEKAVVAIRKELQAHPYHQTGAVNILYRLSELGMDPPSIATINRIIQRNGLLNLEAPKARRSTEYPSYFVNVQQMDLVGPRYLRGGFKFYLYDIIDVETRYAFCYPIPDKSAQSIAPCLVDFWQRFQMPDFLQMDNELSFRGSNKHPRGLGLLMRLALSNGVSPMFIPPAEPWRNGVVERFNGLVQQKLLATQTFTSFEELKAKAASFSLFHNDHHRYSATGQKTPSQLLEAMKSRATLTGELALHTPIPVEEGTLIFIRFIRSDLKLKVLDEVFEVNPELKYSYVVVRIILEHYIAVVSRNEHVYHIFPFAMSIP